VKTSYKPTSVLLSSFIETGNYLPQQYHQTVDMARLYGSIVSDWRAITGIVVYERVKVGLSPVILAKTDGYMYEDTHPRFL
jgi:hypothetical protein